MRGLGGTRRAATKVCAVVCALLASAVASGCGTQHADGTGSTSATALGFTRYAGAVEFPSASDYVPPGMGLRLLVPLDGCVLGVGHYRNGYRDVTANWRGSGGCTRLTLDPAPGGGERREGPPSQAGGWSGGGLGGDAVVPWPDGSLIAVSQTRVVRRTAGGGFTDGARLDLPVRAARASEGSDEGSVHAAARVGTRLLIGAGVFHDGRETPRLFVSDDEGATVRQVELPQVRGGDTAVGSFGVDGRRVVAFGLAATNAFDGATTGSLGYWYSADAGAHWTAGRLTGLPPGTGITAVLRTGGRWLAVGGTTQVLHRPDRPLVFTSGDGLHWTRTDTEAMGSGAVVAAAVDGTGRPVLVGRLVVPAKHVGEGVSYCGAVWVGDASGGWRRGELGCGQAPPTAAATLRDGRVVVAGDRDLWISGGPGTH